jgi:hypothetical protein
MAVAKDESPVEIATAAAAPLVALLVSRDELERRRWALSISLVNSFRLCGLSCGLARARGVV